jgi:aminoglycoside phosphotransferase (APT) family kinase protein
MIDYSDHGMLRARLDGILSGSGRRIVEIAALEGGRSGVTLAATLSSGCRDQAVVVKVAPAGLPPTRNRDVLRQSRLLRALGRQRFPVPHVLIEDAGDGLEQPPLFVMERAEGDCFEPVSDAHTPDTSPHDLASRAQHAARLLADLHAMPAGDVVAEEPSVLHAEVERWNEALRTVDPALVPGFESCAERLLESAPAALPAVVVHGDWRLGNMVCSGNRVNAVIDWEIWSVGDPRLDLAWFLMTTVEEGNPLAKRSIDGYPDAAALLHAYEQRAATKTHELDWFRALARFKGAATMSLTVKHNRRRARPDPSLDSRAPLCEFMLRDCSGWLRSYAGS